MSTATSEIIALRDALTASTAPQDWAAHAACTKADPSVFYPGQGQRSRAAKRICMACPVRLDCLTWALRRNERYGVWGGLGDSDRRRLRRELLSAQAAESIQELAG